MIPTFSTYSTYEPEGRLENSESVLDKRLGHPKLNGGPPSAMIPTYPNPCAQHDSDTPTGPNNSSFGVAEATTLLSHR